MIKMRVTFWFRKTLMNETVIKGLNSACSLLRLDVNFLIKGHSKPASIRVWNEIYNGYKEYEYVGEAKWIMNGESGQLNGKIYWPIQNPGNLPGTVEFDFSWDEKKKSKRKDISTYVFDDVELLLNFLHKLAASVSADRLLIEPARLPTDLLMSRYERFKRIENKTLTNIDWIFGIKSTDKQNQDFKEILNLIHKRTEVAGFVIYALTPNPLSYKSEDDIEFIKSVEEKIGLS